MLTLSIFILLIINPVLACSYAPPLPNDEINCDDNYYGFDDVNTVCAYSSEEPAGYRYIAANRHAACKIPSVRSYFLGSCKGDKVFCDSRYRPTNCNQLHYRPICAFIANCEGEDCKKTIRNPCVACKDPSVDYYIRGRCLEGPHEQRTFCDPNYVPKNCEQTNEPVCAYLQECSHYYYYGLACARTIKNGCIACSTHNIEFYVPGECPNDKIFCDPDNRPKMDGLSFSNCEPTVCVHYSNCNNVTCTESIWKPLACANPYAEYYTLHRCEL
jgi:hypothetical protein